MTKFNRDEKLGESVWALRFYEEPLMLCQILVTSGRMKRTRTVFGSVGLVLI